ncbi:MULTISPECIES: pantoate--beta-alanine ligase [Persicobacter]|uniref:Pantothenate synthetase n=1 Tax=Persicobacter diffluens TaxID=981 RepID=A0AAN5AKL1_9BACT|nr:pantoate--beta-alanine ligase [Persicobacter sp. CCB-QB2]GJM62244.1 pantothenate synthetase [Persicobacter diffluens]
MQVINTISDIRKSLQTVRLEGQSIGFVPTMGALHEGHISLIEQSVKDNDVTVCSIFVNPTQFNNAEDLEKYPRTLEGDIALLEAAKCDYIFAPDAKTMYPGENPLGFNFHPLDSVMEGKFRPGHFSGVGLVVNKLFNIVQPTRAYFGEKDFQQLAIIKKMVTDLNIPIEIVGCPISREANGLARSSRNRRLSEHAKNEIAPAINQALMSTAQTLRRQGSLEKARMAFENVMAKHPEMEVEYMEMVDAHTLEKVEKLKLGQRITVCVAAFLEGVRLIDNRSFNI